MSAYWKDLRRWSLRRTLTGLPITDHFARECLCEGHIFELEWEDLETYVTCPCCHTKWYVGSYFDEFGSCLTLEGDYNLTRQ